MIIVAIDVGKKGAIVIMNYTNGHPPMIESHKMPMLKNDKDYDIRAIKDLILGSNADLIVAEDVHSIHMVSARSNFTFGFGVGIVRGMIETSNISYQLVSPKTWQKEAWQGIRKVKDPKLNSQAAVHRLFPNVNLKASARCTVDHDGIVDAILIGHYAYLKFRQ